LAVDHDGLEAMRWGVDVGGDVGGRRYGERLGRCGSFDHHVGGSGRGGAGVVGHGLEFVVDGAVVAVAEGGVEMFVRGVGESGLAGFLGLGATECGVVNGTDE
jgi:hypothetical protein